MNLKILPLYLILLLLYFTSCNQFSSSGGDTPNTGNTNSCATTVPEISECSAAIDPGASPVALTGTAQFYKRTVTLQSGDLVLGGPIPSALPIKFSEVRVLNSAGTVVQCGKTNASGELKAIDGTSDLQIPQSAGSYTVQVLARSNHTLSGGSGSFKLYTAVKKDFCENNVHSISAAISSTGTGPIAVSGLTAYARESESSNQIQGGAFNIYNDLVTVYEYLASNTGATDLSCLNPKLHVYWQAGFNPAQYIYPDADPADSDAVPGISFYLRGYDELYINGGRLGNVSTVDTDHFDDTVIIHEIGHHLEDVCGKMDSPGGTHNGLFRIDPRLAWSEGWGNYLGVHIIKNNMASINPDPALAAILGVPSWVYYLDTTGYTDGASGTGAELIRLNLSNAGSAPGGFTSGSQTYYYDKVDATNHPGEGHFREISIARSLFKSTNTCASGCVNRSDYFDEVWKSLDKITGMGQSSYPFRTSVRFYERLNANFGGIPAAIDAILNTDEAQQRSVSTDYTINTNLTWPAYGVKLVPTMSACNLEIRPRNEDITVTDALSDQRYSNHFYYIDKATSLPGITTITLTATKQAGTTLDLDLILYQEGYRFVPDSAGSKATSAEQFIRYDRSSGLSKSITSLSSLTSATPYLLNVRAFTTGVTVADTTRYTYILTTNNAGEYLCPTTF